MTLREALRTILRHPGRDMGPVIEALGFNRVRLVLPAACVVAGVLAWLAGYVLSGDTTLAWILGGFVGGGLLVPTVLYCCASSHREGLDVLEAADDVFDLLRPGD